VASLTARATRLIERIRSVNPHAVDAAVALAFTVAALWTMAGRLGGEDEFRDTDALAVVLVLGQTLPIAARSAAPLAALTVSVVAISLHISIGYQGVPAGTFAALVIVYSAGAQSDIRKALLAAAITAAGVTVYFTTDRSDPSAMAAMSTFATYAAAWGLGVYARSRRAYTDVVEERARLLEREREHRAREAVAGERVRIARELHDVVGHALNLIVIQSGGAQRVLQSRPEAARAALAAIESTGREALTDMERMLGILRESDDADGLSPQPGLGLVDALASHVTQAGLPVEVTVEGTAAALPPSVDLTAYRIIQEALTNALKHASASHARVAIRHRPESIELEITDDGSGSADGRSAPRERGRGLIGMQERVGMFGGVLEAAPRAEGGFRVHVRLPIGGGAQ
jgi:signal transduction histidine kinase